MAATLTVGMSEAKTNFSRITAGANRTGRSVTVFRNNKPWVEIRPLAHERVPAPAQDQASAPVQLESGSAPDEYIDAPIPPETLEAMREVEALKNDPNAEVFYSAAELFKAIGVC